MQLIGLNGLKGSGKDTAGSYLVERYGFERLSFAAKLKESAAALFDIDAALWETWKNDPSVGVDLVLQDSILVSLTAREFLQRYGTEAHRDIFGDDFWVRQALGNLDPKKQYVVTDARFENECAAIRFSGGTIVQIVRDAADDGDTHASETPLPEFLVDTVLENNGTIEDLHGTLDTYMKLSDALERTGARIVRAAASSVDIQP